MAADDNFIWKLEQILNKTSITQILHNSNLSNDTRVNPLDITEQDVPGSTLIILSYAILFIVSLFGNTLVCHVVFRNKRMHTVTNMFIVNLAVADLLVTVLNVPFNVARDLLDEWPLGNFVCHLVNFSLMVSVYVSTFTLTAIAIDRHHVIIYPLSPRISLHIGIAILVIIWLVAIGFSLPFGIYSQVNDVTYFVKTVRRCRLTFPEPSDKFEQYLTVITITMQYIVPLHVIAIAYGRIVRRLWSREALGAVTQHQQIRQTKAKRKSIKMLITVVILFTVCWMPLNLYHVLTDLHPNTTVFHYSSSTFFICHLIAVSSTCYNPFIYCWLNEAFRREAKRRLLCCCRHSQSIHPDAYDDGLMFPSEYITRKRGYARGSGSLSRSRAYDRDQDTEQETTAVCETLTINMPSPSSDSHTTTAILEPTVTNGNYIALYALDDLNIHYDESD